MSLLCSVSKFSVLQNCWSYECPEIDCTGQPAGDDLDPHGGRVAGVAGQVSGGGVPVSEGHHHVQGGEGKHNVKEGPAVGNLTIFIIPGSSCFNVSTRPFIFAEKNHVSTSQLGGRPRVGGGDGAVEEEEKKRVVDKGKGPKPINHMRDLQIDLGLRLSIL